MAPSLDEIMAAIGYRLFAQEIGNVMRSDSYLRHKGDGQEREREAMQAALQSLTRRTLSTDKVTYTTTLNDETGRRELTGEERKRVVFLKRLAMRTRGEEEELARLTKTLRITAVVTPKREGFFKGIYERFVAPKTRQEQERTRGLAPLEDQEKRPVRHSPMEMERHAAAAVRDAANARPSAGTDEILAYAAYVAQTPVSLLRLRLRGFIANYANHPQEAPIPVYDETLLPQDALKLRHELLHTFKWSLEETARTLTESYGMHVTTAQLAPQVALQQALQQTSHAPIRMAQPTAEQSLGVQPLERIVAAAVGAYNAAATGQRWNAATKAHAYNAGAASLGLDEETFKDALREHVRARENAPQKARGATIARFDRELLGDYGRFAAEVAQHYASSSLTLKEIATQQGEKYGMRISASAISRIARSYLEGQDKYAKNRREAQQHGQRETAERAAGGPPRDHQ